MKTYVVDCWLKAPIALSLQFLIRKAAAVKRHIWWRISMYEKYHSLTNFILRLGILVRSPSESITWRTSQRQTIVCTSPASALSNNKDLMVGKITNWKAFVGPICDCRGSSSNPEPRRRRATVFHMLMWHKSRSSSSSRRRNWEGNTCYFKKESNETCIWSNVPCERPTFQLRRDLTIVQA